MNVFVDTIGVDDGAITLPTISGSSNGFIFIEVSGV